MIDGNFYKSQEWFPRLDAQNWHPNIVRNDYNEGNLQKAGEEVVGIVGKKEIYTVADAVKFFQTKYHAFQIPWEYLLNYTSGKIIETFYDSAHYHDDEMAPFDYTGNKNHKNVTLIIDIINNRDLRKKYPIIEQMENENKKMQSNGINIPVYHNDFIVIGSFDWKSIESMFTHSPIDDINYEMMYFYHHS